MKLFVCGELHPHPEDWSIWSEWALVIAEDEEAAIKLSGRLSATEIPMDKALYLHGTTQPDWGDDT